MDYYGLIGPLIRLLPAETAHDMALFALKAGLVPSCAGADRPALKSECFGLPFKNPVGLAAGFDKNASALDSLFAQGFGFVEAGTVTPLPQPGNPRPRMFRLEQDEGVINRLGFNNEGMHAFVAHIQRRKGRGILGANIGKNKDSLDAAYDYAACFEAVYPYADYITINISSPNTVGLRDLQQKDALAGLMKTIALKRDDLSKTTGARKPVLYKIAPDLTAQDKEDIAETALAHLIDGLIVGNTTITRSSHLQSHNWSERGGLSGKPLTALSLETLRDIYRLSQGRIPLIGTGGIAAPEDAYARIKAGASLIQVYTALVYHGFGVVRRINEGLVKLLERDGLRNVKEAVGKESGM
jgi:dihydroorotate dehydrogenase